MPVAGLDERGVLRVAGAEARGFLDRLVTCDMDTVAPGRARFGALLTPQGKIIADFVVHAAGEGGEAYLLDLDRATLPDLVRRLTLYRLRAKIAFDDLTETYRVVAGWDGAPEPATALAVAPDPRLAAMGWRAIVPGPSPDHGIAGYADHRIALGVPEGGRDFAWSDAFPHEALMDQLAGVDFDKGCYVGQEVVSRMQHRGTARTRIVPVAYPEGTAAAPGTPVEAGGRALGTAGTAAGAIGLATLRLDRLADALAEGAAPEAGGHALRLRPKPNWIRFPWPGEGAVA